MLPAASASAAPGMISPHSRINWSNRSISSFGEKEDDRDLRSNSRIRDDASGELEAAAHRVASACAVTLRHNASTSAARSETRLYFSRAAPVFSAVTPLTAITKA